MEGIGSGSDKPFYSTELITTVKRFIVQVPEYAGVLVSFESFSASCNVRGLNQVNQLYKNTFLTISTNIRSGINHSSLFWGGSMTVKMV